MTGTKREDGTTLRVQPCRTAAVVGRIMRMRVASPLYAEARCFRLHVGTIGNRTTSKQSSVIFLDSKKQTAVDISANGTTLRSCRPAAVQPPSISSLQPYARVADVVEADCLIGACHLSPHHTPCVRCAVALCASPLHVHRSRQFWR